MKGDTPSFYEPSDASPNAAAQTPLTYPLLTFRAKLHDQQAELFNAGKDRITTTRFFYELYRKNKLLLLYSGAMSRLVRGFVIATQDATALHNK